MTRTEIELCSFLHDQISDVARAYDKTGDVARLSRFKRHLWEAIASADDANLQRLNNAFDDQVNAWKRHKRENGYYDKLRVEYDALMAGPGGG